MFGASTKYLAWIEQFGEPVILTPKLDISDIDLLVLPGGPDMSSSFYNEPPSYFNSNADKYKDFFFANNLRQYVESKTPIFGICLGMQQLNVHFGGNLCQHYNFDYSTPRTDCKEELILHEEIYNLVNSKKAIKVNTLHHQGIFDNNIGNNLTILGKSKVFNNVEIFRHDYLPIYGVQYHPEEINDIISYSIMQKLLNNE